MRSHTLFAVVAWGFIASANVAAADRCAYVDVGVFDMTEPKQQCFSLDMACGPNDEYGCFPSPLAFKDGWVDGGPRGKLRELSDPFTYIDRDGVHWDVPAGYQTDGATIPVFFRPIIGGPWTDSYIKAAVVHDFYIRRSTVNADAVHKMFYLALLAAGNSQRRAGDMAFAVKNFGPQWKHVEVAQFEAAWQARKYMLDRITKWHQDVWEAFQASERKREQQAAIDRASLKSPSPRAYARLQAVRRRRRAGQLGRICRKSCCGSHRPSRSRCHADKNPAGKSGRGTEASTGWPQQYLSAAVHDTWRNNRQLLSAH